MRLTFVGHACVLIEFVGTRVLTDPYSPAIGGYSAVAMEADLVTVSHSNPKWHSCLDDVIGAYEVFEGLNHLGGTTRIQGVQLEAMRVFERLSPGQDETQTGGEGSNAMIKITSDGVRVLHMGDIGHAPSDATLAACGAVDVLLAPAGGAPTIGLDDLLAFVAKLRPRVVIPLHFAVPHLTMELLPVEDLVSKWRSDSVVIHATATLDLATILAAPPATPQLHLLPPRRLQNEASL